MKDGGIELNTPPLPLLRKSYNLPDYLELSPMNAYWRLNIDHRPAYFLKCLTSDTVHARHVWRSLNYLANRGINPLPVWVKTVQGEPFFEWSGRQWVLIPWINGTKAPVYTPEGFPKLLRLLSKVHQFGKDCPYGEWFIPNVAFSKRLADLESYQSMRKKTAFAHAYCSYLPYYIETARRAIHIIKAQLPGVGDQATLCHGDPSPRNTLCLGDGRWALLDWDRLVQAPRWWELSQAIRRFQNLRAWKAWPLWERIDNHVQIRLAYCEKVALWGCLLFPQEFWRIGNQYFHESLKRPESWFLHRLERIWQLEPGKKMTLIQWARPLNPSERLPSPGT